MLVGVSPTADIGPTGWARSTVAIMRSPDFFPQILALNEISAIGSGSGVELYIKELKDLQRHRNTLWKMEILNPGGYGTMLLDILQQTIQNHPSPGISHHLHLCLVRRDKVELIKSDHTVFSEDDPPVGIKMPAVASSWAEFTICAMSKEWKRHKQHVEKSQNFNVVRFNSRVGTPHGQRTDLYAVAILDAYTLESKKRAIDTRKMREALDF
jgi:hypothetical protein